MRRNGTIAVLLFCGALQLRAVQPISLDAPGRASGSGFTVLADFNGDGKPDLLQVNSRSTTVRLGKGDGSFGAAIANKAGASYAVVADFNGDGKMDVAESTDRSDQISILLGNGDGTFQAPVAYTVQGPSGQIAVGDLDGDGKPDLVAIVNSKSHVGIAALLGNGDGTFGKSTFFSSGTTGGGFVIIGDFTGDGRPDVVLLGENIFLFKGHGDGTFFTAAEVSGPVLAYWGAAGDFNGDGILDLAFAADPQGLEIMLGKGNGTFHNPVNVAVAGRPGPLTAGDVNGDGKIDLVVSASYGITSVFLGHGDGKFSKPIDLGGAANIASVVIGDVNGDGHPDLVVGGNSTAIFLNNGHGHFPGTLVSPSGSVSYSNGPRQTAVGDFNGDGKVDVAVAAGRGGNSNLGSVQVLLGNGGGSFQAPINTETVGIAETIAAGDFNGDGRLDVAVGLRGAGKQSLAILLGNGDGTFQAPAYYNFRETFVTMAILDLNGDGKADLVIGTGQGTVAVLLGNGDGTLQPAKTYLAGLGVDGMVIADFNGDGKPDVAVSWPGPGVGGYSVLLGNGDGTFQASSDISLNTKGGSIAGGDFNGDGIVDLAVADRQAGSVTVLLGNGDGTFQAGLKSAAGTEIDSLAAADFNGDSKLDLVVTGGTRGGVVILAGKGDGKFAAGPAYSAGIKPDHVVIYDFNGDGRPDLLLSNNSVRSLYSTYLSVALNLP